MVMKRKEISVKKVNILIKKKMLFVKYGFRHAYIFFREINAKIIDVRQGFTDVQGKNKEGNRN
jgi:hypothetical protein